MQTPVDRWLYDCSNSQRLVDMYSDLFLSSFQRSDFFTQCKKRVAGKLKWNKWVDCSVTCGGGHKFRTAKQCVPPYAQCYDLQIMEESCNQQACPETPSTFLPPGTIIPWVPKPHKSSSSAPYAFSDDTWVICDGTTTCKKGLFKGQACSDLSDRVLVGAGRTGSILDLKDASLPDHEHAHRHTGTKTYKINYKNGPLSLGSGKKFGSGSGSLSAKHDHNGNSQTEVTIDFGVMSESRAPISKIHASKVTKTTKENELYSSHMRVYYLFKCY